MNEKSIKRNYRVLIIIGIVLILGSLYQLIISLKTNDTFGKFLHSISLALWLISIICSVLLYKKNSRKEIKNKPHQQ